LAQYNASIEASMGEENMRTLEVQVYQFSELPDEAKDKAREWVRDLEAQDFEPCYGQYDDAAKLLGIAIDETGKKQFGVLSTPDIRYSGFSSQGDGASFTGRYDFKPCCQEIRAEFPTDTKLHAIADGLTALHNRLRLLTGQNLEGGVSRSERSGSYYHNGTMDAVVLTAEGDELDWDDPVTKEFLELMRDFAQWIYDGLEAEYDYRMSDAAIDESIEANEYEFDEDGDRI
jgi:hypothetical protein